MARRSTSVAIIGAGAGGIAMGVMCRRLGLEFTIFERSDGVGGTWRDNTYPGAACDVPSHLYSFSFEPNPDWSRTFATQPEILAYLEHCATKYGLREHLRCNTAIREARWLDDDLRWQLTTEAGEVVEADVLVTALGMLNVPHLPDLPGHEQFRGAAFHSARWDHDVDLSGKRVGVLGTGASAVQFVPKIADDADRVILFQRTPTWIRPRLDAEYTEEQRREFATNPRSARRHRRQIYRDYERSNAFRADAPDAEQMTAFAQSYLERKVEDPELRAVLTPDHPVGCKRPLISREWYPTLVRDDVEVVPAGVAAMTEHGVVTDAGDTYDVDVLVFGTGFRASEYLRSIEVYGRGGRRLHDDWADGAEAYLGMTVPGYPNLFVMYGPNTNGVQSILFLHEAQAHYIGRATRHLHRRRARAVEVKAQVAARYNAKVQAALVGTVWEAGCNNYFHAESGKNVTQMPFKSSRYWLRTRIFPSWKYRRLR